MRISRDRPSAIVDPADPRLVVGTEEERKRAREELRRRVEIAQAMKSGLEEIPRDRLRFSKYVIEDEVTGSFYSAVRGVVNDTQFTNAVAFFFNEQGDPVYLERPAAGPRSRDELAAKRAEREQRRSVAKPKRIRARTR
jgi:hypothetical protein